MRFSGVSMDKKRILIIDDDKVVLESLRRLLELHSYEALAVQEAGEAFSKAKSFNPDVILLDLLMPRLGGLEICEMLNSDKETRGIPIIVVSALDKEADIKKAYRLGVVGYITKPYDLNKLLQEINKAIAYKQEDLA